MATDTLSHVMKILADENHLVERADQKAISMLSILGVFMVFFVVYYRVIPINLFTGTLIILYFFFALLSILTLISAIRPRIRKDTDETNASSISVDPTFFSGIAGFPNATAYKKMLEEVLKNEDNIIDIYIRQIYSVARINTVKYKHVQRAVVLVITTLAIELVLITYLFIYHLGQDRMPPIS